MNKDIVKTLKQQFAEYVQSFRLDDAKIQGNLYIKQEHTKRVCQEVVMLGKQLGLDPADLYLAEVMALFHDIGRFQQYTTYRTYMDRDSVNHAELGVKILKEREMLHLLDASTQDLVLRVISYHNRAFLPQNESEICLFFAKLLRDADKLDIWRVVIEYYSRNNGEHNEAVSLGLPDTPEISEAVCEDLRAKRIVDIRHLKTLNDFKLLQMGWVYDINFVPTLQAVLERKYLEQIRATLLQSKEVEKIVATMCNHLQEKIRSSVKIHQKTFR